MASITIAWTVNYFIFVNQLSVEIRQNTFQGISNTLSNSLKLLPSLSVGTRSFLYAQITPTLRDVNGTIINENTQIESMLYQNFLGGLAQTNGEYLSIEFMSNVDGNYYQHFFSGSSRNVVYQTYSHNTSQIRWFKVENISSGHYDVNRPLQIVNRNANDMVATLRSEALDTPNVDKMKGPYFSCDIINANDCIMYIEFYYHVVCNKSDCVDDWIGSVRVSLAGRTISNLLRQTIRSDAIAFIIDINTNHLIAASNVISSYGVTNDLGTDVEGDPDLYDVRHYHNDFIAQIGREIIDTYKLTSDVENFNFHLFYNMFDIYIIDVNLLNGTSWMLVHSLPYLAYNLSPIVIGCISLLVSVILMGFIMVFTLSLFISIIRPLNKLMSVISNVSDMNLSMGDSESKMSSLFEIKQIQLSFLNMLEMLKKYKSFLPQDLVAVDLIMDNNDRDERTNIFSATVDENKEGSSSKSGEFSVNSESTVRDSIQDTFSHKSSYVDERVVRFSLALRQKEMAILTISFNNVNELLNELTVQDFVDLYSKFFDNVLSKSITRHKGVILSGFNEKTISAKFEKGTFVLRAMSCYFTFDREFKIFKREEVPNIPFDVTMGITSGICFEGSLGGQRIKQKAIVGEQVLGLSKFLSQYARKMNTKCLINKDIFSRCNILAEDATGSRFTVRPVDVIYLPKERELFFVYELLELHDFQNDEWMYEIESKKKVQKYSDLLQAFDELSDIKLSIQNKDAIEKIEERFEIYLQNNKNDKVVQKMLKKLNENYVQNLQMVIKHLQNKKKYRRFYDLRFFSCIYNSRGMFKLLPDKKSNKHILLKDHKIKSLNIEIKNPRRIKSTYDLRYKGVDLTQKKSEDEIIKVEKREKEKNLKIRVKSNVDIEMDNMELIQNNETPNSPSNIIVNPKITDSPKIKKVTKFDIMKKSDEVLKQVNLESKWKDKEKKNNNTDSLQMEDVESWTKDLTFK